MFRNPFSFTGRIRRLEYGLSYLIFLVLYFLGSIVVSELEEGGIIFVFLFFVFNWFLLAQGAKRCHDLGHNGFFQLIPFYGIWMLFGEGTTGDNKYGMNPKDLNFINTDKTPFQAKVNLPKGKTRLGVLNELISIVLLNALLIVIVFHYLKYYKGPMYIVILVSTILCFFLFLVLTNKGFALPHLRPYLFRLRVSYAFLLYISLRLYVVAFLKSEFDMIAMFYELLYIGIILGITYVPFLLYPIFFKTQQIDD